MNRLPCHHTSHVPVLAMPPNISPVFIIESCSLVLFLRASNCPISGKTGSTSTAVHFVKVAMRESKFSRPITTLNLCDVELGLRAKGMSVPYLKQVDKLTWHSGSLTLEFNDALLTSEIIATELPYIVQFFTGQCACQVVVTAHCLAFIDCFKDSTKTNRKKHDKQQNISIICNNLFDSNAPVFTDLRGWE
jgi:hypothetical protein